MTDSVNNEEQGDPNDKTWIVPTTTLPAVDTFLQGLVAKEGRLYAEMVTQAAKCHIVISREKDEEHCKALIQRASLVMALMNTGYVGNATQEDVMADAVTLLELGIKGVEEKLASGEISPEQLKANAEAAQKVMKEMWL